MYVRAQRNLGAAKTSAYYAFAPFIGSILAVLVNGESLNAMYFISFGVMLAGTVFVILDTFKKRKFLGRLPLKRAGCSTLPLTLHPFVLVVSRTSTTATSGLLRRCSIA